MILSPHFIKKPWPEYEFRSLVALESGRPKKILPIWHNVTRKEVLKYSPHLTDKVAVIANGKPSMHVALEITKVAHPERFRELARRFALERERENNVKFAPIESLVKWPCLREPLTQSQLRRLRLVQEALMDAFSQSWEDMVADF